LDRRLEAVPEDIMTFVEEYLMLFIMLYLLHNILHNSNRVSVPYSELAHPPLNQKGGQHSLAGEGVGGANPNDWRESLTFVYSVGILYSDRNTSDGIFKL
jgi:hypothetical protein